MNTYSECIEKLSLYINDNIYQDGDNVYFLKNGSYLIDLEGDDVYIVRQYPRHPLMGGQYLNEWIFEKDEDKQDENNSKNLDEILTLIENNEKYK